jgi:hypothetical protein
MPREGFSRKRCAAVRSLGSAAAKSNCGCRNHHIIIYTITATAAVRIMTVIAMSMRGSASISPRWMARLTTRYRHAAKMVSTPPRPIMHSPSASEMPVWRTRIAGLAPEDISRIHRLNRAITNPKLITAMLVRTQGRNVRSLARISASILSGSSRPFRVEHSSSPWKWSFNYQFVSLIAHGLARSMAESVNSTT